MKPRLASPAFATVAVAVAAFACAAALGYSASRVIQATLFPGPDPRAPIAVTRIAFYWRSWVSFYVGVLAALGAAALRTRAPAKVDAALVPAIVSTAVLTTLQGVFVP